MRQTCPFEVGVRHSWNPKTTPNVFFRAWDPTTCVNPAFVEGTSILGRTELKRGIHCWDIEVGRDTCASFGIKDAKDIFYTCNIISGEIDRRDWDSHESESEDDENLFQIAQNSNFYGHETESNYYNETLHSQDFSTHAHNVWDENYNVFTRAYSAWMDAYHTVTQAYNAVNPYNVGTDAYNAVAHAYYVWTDAYNAITHACNVGANAYNICIDASNGSSHAFNVDYPFYDAASNIQNPEENLNQNRVPDEYTMPGERFCSMYQTYAIMKYNMLT